MSVRCMQGASKCQSAMRMFSSRSIPFTPLDYISNCQFPKLSVICGIPSVGRRVRPSVRRCNAGGHVCTISINCSRFVALSLSHPTQRKAAAPVKTTLGRKEISQHSPPPSVLALVLITARSCLNISSLLPFDRRVSSCSS